MITLGQAFAALADGQDVFYRGSYTPEVRQGKIGAVGTGCAFECVSRYGHSESKDMQPHAYVMGEIENDLLPLTDIFLFKREVVESLIATQQEHLKALKECLKTLPD